MDDRGRDDKVEFGLFLGRKERISQFAELRNFKKYLLFFFFAFPGLFLFFFIGTRILLGNLTFTHDAILWFGLSDYFFDSIKNGNFPFWDPYSHLGTPFFANINILGFLDPLAFLAGIPHYLFNASTLLCYNLFYLGRIFVFVVGAFYLFRHFTRSLKAGLVGSVVLLLIIAPVGYRQNGVVNSSFLLPIAMYFWMRFLDVVAKFDHKPFYFLLCWAVCVSFSALVYLPAIFVFSFLVFAILLFVFGIYDIRILKSLLSLKWFIRIAFVLTLILVCMAPGFATLYETTAKGELFPILRSIHASRGIVKLSDSALGQKLFQLKDSAETGSTKFVGITWLNYLQYIYPSFWNSYFGNLGGDISEVFLGIGTVAMSLCLVVFATIRTRKLYLIVAALFIFGLLSCNAKVLSQPSHIQLAMISLFPPLKLLDVFENFGAETLLFSAMAVALAVRHMEFTLKSLVVHPLKRMWIMGLLAIFFVVRLVVAKLVFTNFKFSDPLELLYTFLGLIVIFALYKLTSRDRFIIYSSGGNRFSIRLIGVVLTLAISVELGTYHYFLSNRKTLQLFGNISQYLEERDSESESPEMRKNLKYFRNDTFAHGLALPYFNLLQRHKSWSPKLQFDEPNSFFSTRRYYQFISNVPVATQLALVNIANPVLQFHPIPQLLYKSKNAALAFISSTEPSFFDDHVVIEQDSISEEMPQNSRMPSAEVLKGERVLDFVNPGFDQKLNDLKERLSSRELANERKLSLESIDNDNLQLRFLSEGPSIVRIHAKVPEAGAVVLNDGWSRYWKASVDDRPVDVKIANYNFKAVLIDKGEHLIEFRFDPYIYRYALYLYYFGLFMFFVFIFLYRGIGETELIMFAKRLKFAQQNTSRSPEPL